MKAIAVFCENHIEREAARQKLLDGDYAEIPEIVESREEMIFSIQDVKKIWTDEDQMTILFNDGSTNNFVFDKQVWESISQYIDLLDKGYTYKAN